MEKNMEHDMEAEFIKGLYMDPGIQSPKPQTLNAMQITPTLGP